MLIVLYDNNCPLCRKSREWLEAIDKTGLIIFKDLHDPMIIEQYNNLTYEELEAELHVILQDGQTYRGAAAYREIGKIVSPNSFGGMLLKLFSFMARIPIIFLLADWLYTIVAKNRQCLSLLSCKRK